MTEQLVRRFRDKYQDAVAFITGGASGAGFGQAQIFGRAGCRIVIADVRRDPLDAAAAALTEEGIRVHPVQLDISDRKAYEAAADEVEQVYGEPPRLLFNTAGVNGFGPLDQATDEDFQWILGVNLMGVVHGMQTFVPRMLAAGEPAHVVTTGSMAGFEGSPAAAIYAASKAAVFNLMESYDYVLPSKGIDVSVLCPASIRTNIADSQDARPAHLALGSAFRGDEEFKQLQRELYSTGMDPQRLALHVMEGIVERRLYLLPFPETKEGLRRHFEKILDSFTDMEEVRVEAEQRARDFEAYRRRAAAVARDG